MEKEIKQIDIIPAIFIKYREDGNILLRCLQDEETVDRAFEPILFKNIKNIKYLLLGIATGVNNIQLNVCDGNEFEDLYLKHWNVLLK